MTTRTNSVNLERGRYKQSDAADTACEARSNRLERARTQSRVSGCRTRCCGNQPVGTARRAYGVGKNPMDLFQRSETCGADCRTRGREVRLANRSRSSASRAELRKMGGPDNS